MLKRMILVVMSLIVLTVPVALASAQGPRGNDARPPQQMRDARLPGDVVDILTSATGLDGRAFIAALRDGNTIADVLAENGADVEAVTADVTAALLERLGEAEAAGRIDAERAAEMRENLAERVDALINEIPPNRQQDDRVIGVLAQAITDATGLDLREIAEQARDGTTITEILAANDVDADTLTAEVIAELETHLQEAVDTGNMTEEQAATLLENAQARLNDWLTGDVTFAEGVRDRVQERFEGLDRATFNQLGEIVTEQTGLTLREIVGQVRDGATLAEVIAENGGDVEIITDAIMASFDERLDAALADGNLSEEQATALRERAENRINDWLSGEAPLPRPDRR